MSALATTAFLPFQSYVCSQPLKLSNRSSHISALSHHSFLTVPVVYLIMKYQASYTGSSRMSALNHHSFLTVPVVCLLSPAFLYRSTSYICSRATLSFARSRVIVCSRHLSFLHRSGHCLLSYHGSCRSGRRNICSGPPRNRLARFQSYVCSQPLKLSNRMPVISLRPATTAFLPFQSYICSQPPQLSYRSSRMFALRHHKRKPN
ncbi:hypothetical protein AVEN_39826-1 [Araneus ventricosus]|uniref:Uncharacterized protein n=1 Tax=Araneus ventricosus TaxID=182803 RepID=A0A4Y2PD21_ARAVE|nr:hypothetical protein AVEN_39826-1 [Araneus ventricosus]